MTSFTLKGFMRGLIFNRGKRKYSSAMLEVIDPSSYHQPFLFASKERLPTRLEVYNWLSDFVDLNLRSIITNKNGYHEIPNSNYIFSYSDCGDELFICLSLEGVEVGVDVEVFTLRDWSIFQGTFFSYEDWSFALRISSQLSIDINFLLLVLFSAKEASLKLLRLNVDPLNLEFFDLVSSESHFYFEFKLRNRTAHSNELELNCVVCVYNNHAYSVAYK